MANPLQNILIVESPNDSAFVQTLLKDLGMIEVTATEVMHLHKFPDPDDGKEMRGKNAIGSKLKSVSQFLDSFVVVFIALYLGQSLPFLLVLAISMMSYLYKAVVALLLTPLLYIVHARIDAYLGHDVAMTMRAQAMEE